MDKQDLGEWIKLCTQGGWKRGKPYRIKIKVFVCDQYYQEIILIVLKV